MERISPIQTCQLSEKLCARWPLQAAMLDQEIDINFNINHPHSAEPSVWNEQ